MTKSKYMKTGRKRTYFTGITMLYKQEIRVKHIGEGKFVVLKNRRKNKSPITVNTFKSDLDPEILKAFNRYKSNREIMTRLRLSYEDYEEILYHWECDVDISLAEDQGVYIPYFIEFLRILRLGHHKIHLKFDRFLRWIKPFAELGPDEQAKYWISYAIH